jgi:hypothetical protein
VRLGGGRDLAGSDIKGSGLVGVATIFSYGNFEPDIPQHRDLDISRHLMKSNSYYKERKKVKLYPNFFV